MTQYYLKDIFSQLSKLQFCTRPYRRRHLLPPLWFFTHSWWLQNLVNLWLFYIDVYRISSPHKQINAINQRINLFMLGLFYCNLVFICTMVYREKTYDMDENGLLTAFLYIDTIQIKLSIKDTCISLHANSPVSSFPIMRQVSCNLVLNKKQ